MAEGFEAVFAALKGVMEKHSERLLVGADTAARFSLNSHAPSPFPQHKGQPMWFGEVRLGKAYVSYHLMPLYMNPALEKTISAELKKHMQGKTCFNFKKEPEGALLKELDALTTAALLDWDSKHWV